VEILIIYILASYQPVRPCNHQENLFEQKNDCAANQSNQYKWPKKNDIKKKFNPSPRFSATLSYISIKNFHF